MHPAANPGSRPDHGAQEAEWVARCGVRLISNMLLEVRPEVLKSHGVGRLVLNAMVGWARRYHPGDAVLPIATTDDEPIGSKLIDFYALFGVTFPRERCGFSKISNATTVSALRTAPIPWLASVGPSHLTVTR